MPKKIKSKARLDKWYRIAKEQGYRSRAAFKLIQLNRKYNFLNNANVLVDLCAAPGGWLQVATRYMPVNSIKIGIDLISIKHVPGCITLQEDITTPRCLAMIKKEIKNEKVDVVLNDGAPNVGANWSKDAYSQVELVLAALKLAATVLRKGGTFVTKVFRSADYNSIVWVLNKFFEKVEATKPAASRTQSAEIFIVCLRYIAPDYTDPKLFDSRFVFQDTEGDILKASNADKVASIDKLLEQKRNRQGYADDMPVSMFKTISFEEFLNTDNALNTFAKSNRIALTDNDKEKYLSLVSPPEDYEDIIQDLKSLGKREIQTLLKWRTRVLRKLGKTQKKEKENDNENEKMEEIKEEQEHNTDSELEEEIRKERHREIKEMKKDKEKKLNQLARLKEMAPQQIDTNDEIGFDWVKNKKVTKLGFVDLDDEEDDDRPVMTKKARDNKEVEDNIELLYELKKKKIKYEEDKAIRRQEEKRRKKFGDEVVDEEKLQLETIQKSGQEDYETVRRDGYGATEDDLAQLNESTVALAQNYLKTSKWFDRDIFKEGIAGTNEALPMKNPIRLEKSKASKADEEEEEKGRGRKGKDEDSDEEADDEIKINKKEKLKLHPSLKGSEKRKRKLRQHGLINMDHEEEDNGKIEVVPAMRYEDYDVDSLAEMRVLAQKMLRKKDREEIMEDSYNRYSHSLDENAPDWFVEDERKRSVKMLPVTKEEVLAEKQRLLAIKNRPIKKVVEAKIRRKMQVQKKLKKAQDKAKDIMEQEGVTESSKLKQVQKLYKKAMAGKKEEKKYIVSRTFNAKQAKGKGGNRKVGRTTRLVDSRLKKDKRAQKNKEKRGGGPKIHKSKKRQMNRRKR